MGEESTLTGAQLAAAMRDLAADPSASGKERRKRQVLVGQWARWLDQEAQFRAQARLAFGAAAWDAFVQKFEEQAHARASRRPGWRETYADHGCADCADRERCTWRLSDPTVTGCSEWSA